MKCVHCGSEWNIAPQASVAVNKCPFCGKPLAFERKETAETLDGVLVQIAEQFGLENLRDGKRMIGFFADLAPKMKREQRLLGYFVEAEGHKVLFEARNFEGVDQQLAFGKVIRRMTDEMLMDKTASQQVCEAYWAALTGKPIQVENSTACSDSDSANSIIKTCGACQGSGQIHTIQNFMGMPMQSTDLCPNCKGKGKVRHIQKIKVPCDVDDDQGIPVRVENNVVSAKNNTSSNKRKRVIITHKRVQVLIEKKKYKSSYLCKGMNGFDKQVAKAKKHYAQLTDDETPLLIFDFTVLGDLFNGHGSAKQGYVLTDQNIYYNMNGRKGKTALGDITAVSINGDYVVLNKDSKDNECRIFGGTEESRQDLQRFWKELLCL